MVGCVLSGDRKELESKREQTVMDRVVSMILRGSRDRALWGTGAVGKFENGESGTCVLLLFLLCPGLRILS